MNDRLAGELEEFIDKACSLNCAAADRQFDRELLVAREILNSDPQLPVGNLYAAAAIGDIDSVQGFLKDDPSLATKRGGPRDWPPLLYVCFSRFMRDENDPERTRGLLQTARFLLDAGADPNSYFMLGDEKETALYGACGVCNNADLASLLLEFGAEVNDEDATYHVAEFPNHDCIRVLFEHGLDADRSATVLLRKLDFDDYEGVRLILDLGCDVNHMGYWKKSPLHQAVMRGRDLVFIQLLVERGADVNAKRYDGATACYLASLQGRQNVVDFLVNNGASQDFSTVERFLVACGLGQADQVQELLQDEPELMSRLNPDQHALIASLGAIGNLQGLKTMLVAGFDIAARDSQGFTALHWAAWYGHLDCVKFLIAQGAPLDAKNNYGGTVIDSTVWGYANSDGNDRHCREILEVLVAAGADPMTVSPFPSGHESADQIISELRSSAGNQTE